MKNIVLAAVTGSVLFLGGATADAHHSLSVFDRGKTITLTGTVKDFAWTSPHVFIEIVADNAKGEGVLWSVEGAAPAVLARNGWRPSVLKPGDKISLSIHPRKDGASGGYYADARPILINNEPFTGEVPSSRGSVRSQSKSIAT